MKKILTIFALITVLSASVPAFAAPPPPPPAHSNHYIHAGHRHHMMHPAPPHRPYIHPYGSFTIFSNNYHSWGYPYCHCPYCMAHRPHTGIGVNIHF